MPNVSLPHLRSRMGKLCVAVTGVTAAEMLERAAAAATDTSFLEFRLDYLAKPAAALPVIGQFLTANASVTAIATCRRTANGGRFDGTVAAETAILAKAAAAGFHLIDLEVESAEAMKGRELEKVRGAGAALLISHHDFHALGDLDAVYTRIARFTPDFVKVVPTATRLTDNLTLLRFLEQGERAGLVALCMGEQGVLSRVLGPRAGSTFTFASATAGAETAPGQIAARSLLDTYRIAEIDAATKVYGLAGNPVGHSLSPLMLNTAFRRETVNAVYLALPTPDVADLVDLVRRLPLHGLSVTMPHKQAILPFLTQTDPLSARIGAVNTVLRGGDGNLYGFNTDVAGILAPLDKRLPLRGARVLVLGAGGAARAAVFALKERQAEIFILNRTIETAAKLAKQAGAKLLKREALGKSSFDVILNATPIGMKGQSPEGALKPHELRTQLVFDMVYNPVETPLLKLAKEQGIAIITGVEMFIQQGARQFEIWTNKPAPVEEMTRVVLHALNQRDST